MRFTPTRVLDAGCGTGRVARELAQRGVAVVGVDVDAQMLATARAKAPELVWIEHDLASLDLARDAATTAPAPSRPAPTDPAPTDPAPTVPFPSDPAPSDLTPFDLILFDLVVLAGNVMIFVSPGTEGDVLNRLAAHLQPGGHVVAGFQLQTGRLDLATYDACATDAGLELTERWATWSLDPFVAEGATYAVSVHRLRPA